MSFGILSLLLPFVLAIHNLEEYSRYEDLVRASYERLPKKITTRRVIRFSMLLLTFSVAC